MDGKDGWTGLHRTGLDWLETSLSLPGLFAGRTTGSGKRGGHLGKAGPSSWSYQLMSGGKVSAMVGPLRGQGAH